MENNKPDRPSIGDCLNLISELSNIFKRRFQLIHEYKALKNAYWKCKIDDCIFKSEDLFLCLQQVIRYLNNEYYEKNNKSSE